MASTGDGLWYETSLPELIDGTLERGGYEERELEGLRRMATSLHRNGMVRCGGT